MTNAIDAATSFKIVHGHGVTETGIDTYDEAVQRVRLVYSEVEIGHSGDLLDGGRKTLCWPDAATAENGDGSRACCSIVALFEDD